MRYSAIIKFFAVFLCAAVILTALGSGIGMLALTETGLYSRSLAEVRREDTEVKVQSMASGIAARYASLNLGNMSKSMANDIYGIDYSFYEPDRVGYVLKDADGAVLQTQKLPDQYSAQQIVPIEVKGQYMKVLTEQPAEPEETQPGETGEVQVHAFPNGNAEVSQVHLEFADGTVETHHKPDEGNLGLLGMENGDVYLTADYLYSPGLEEGKPLEFITILDMNRCIAYEAYGEDGLALGYSYEEGQTLLVLPGSSSTDGPAAPTPGTTVTSGDFTAYDAMTGDQADVYGIQISYGSLEEGTTAGTGVTSVVRLGTLIRNPDGNVWFIADDAQDLDIPEDALITAISFQDENKSKIYEVNCPSGVGKISYDQDGRFYFYGENPGLNPQEERVPEATAPEMAERLRAVVREDTDVYSMPSLTGRKVGSLTAGAEVEVLQRESFGTQSWALVTQGWVDMADLVLEQALPEQETVPEMVKEPVPESVQAVATGNTPIYAMPNGEKSVGEVKKGDTVTLIQQGSYNGQPWGLTEAGWVQMQFLTVLEPVPAALETVPLEETIPAETAALEETMAQETLPEETAPEAAEARALALPEGEDPLAGYEPEEIRTYSYMNHETGVRMEAKYVMEWLPDYTLEVHLAPGADQAELLWLMLAAAYYPRNHLLPILGLSLALLALCVVYICCAAAHKRGSDVIRAGGLNRIPLDADVVLVCCLLAGTVVLGYEGAEYFARKGQELYAMATMAGGAYLCSLIVVCFCFAFVAQIKTPGGYWWRNSICGRCLLLVVRLCRKTVVFCSTRGGAMAVTGAKGLWKGSQSLWQVGKKTALHSWDIFKRLCLWAWEMMLRFTRWIRGHVARLFGMLPVTWQFLTTGFVLVCFLYVMIRTYKVGYILLGFGLFFAVILYAATAFAILLESARRMSKGDLDTQVDDRMLIGAFRDFARRLNDLAGVAVIAAQKQLKSERMKTELITNVSHDIKTPLTSIINYVDLLRKPHTQQQQEQYLEVLDRQSQRLKKLIDDLMEMSKASTGNLTVDIAKVDAAEAVNQALGEFADKLDRVPLVPVFRQPEEQVYMMADGRLVWRVMSNLLGNAVKYALPGTRVYLDLLEMDGKVIISMKNISREELNVNAEELMERFVRGDASRNTEGSGLGLNIARSLMELQKGQLQILVDGDLFKVTLIFPGA